MPSYGQQAIDIAEGQVGCVESPKGSNQGACVNKYQDIYGTWYRGQPWCGCFVGWVWEQVHSGWKQYSSPSTAEMCSSKPNCSPMVGAAFVICGTHTGLLRYKINSSTWATVEGNHNDQVAFSQRNISGMQFVAPPDLAKQATPEPPPTSTWYFLQDVVRANALGQHDYYGGWPTEEGRNSQYGKLKKSLGHELRKFKDNDWDSPFFLDNTSYMNNHGGVEVYGGWSSEDARDNARKTLEARLQRTIRPFSETRTKAQGGVPWACKNLDS